MSIVRQQLNSFIESAIGNILRNGKSIPTRGRIFAEIDDHITKYGLTLGQPTYKGLQQNPNGVSNPDLYNLNIDTLRFDFDIFFDESVSQAMRLLQNFNASYIINRRLLAEITGLTFEIEKAKELRGGYRYIVSDSFNDSTLVDQTRSTTQLDLATGKIKLPLGVPKTADLSFLSDRTEPHTIRFNRTLLSKVTSPGSHFGKIIDGTSAYWQMHAHTGTDGPLSMSFQVPISRDGRRIKINGVFIEPLMSSSATVIIEYREGMNWKVATQETLNDRNTFTFPSVITDTIRLTITKQNADTRLGNRYVYDYGIRSMVVFLAITQQEGEFYSKSLKLSPGLQQDATAVSLDLYVDDHRPPGTEIEYSVAIDEYVSGTFYPSGQYSVAGVNPYTHGNNALYFSSDVSGNYVLRSSLRDFPFTDLHREWVPNWKVIQPSRADGTVGQTLLLDFATRIDKDHGTSGFSSTIESIGKYSNIDHLKIYEFKDDYRPTLRPIPSDIVLYQGKGCWLIEEKLFQYNQQLLGEGIVKDGRLLILGQPTFSIVPGSIKNLRPWGEGIESEIIFVDREDYLVNYGYPNVYSAEIVATGGKMTILGTDQLAVKFEYAARTIEPLFSLHTSIRYEKNESIQSREGTIESPIVKIVWYNSPSTVVMEEVTISNYVDGVLVGESTESEKSHGTVVEMNLEQIGSGYGTFEINIRLKPPTDMFSYTPLVGSFSSNIPGLLTNVSSYYPVYSIPTEHPGGVVGWLQERAALRNAEATSKAGNNEALNILLTELSIGTRIIIPSFLSIFAWKDPLTRVSEDYMKYRTHKFDHTKFTLLRQNDGYQALVVNNPGVFQRQTRLIKDNQFISSTTGLVGKDASEFYEISYKYSSGRFDSVLLRAILRGVGSTTPEVRSYSLRVTG